MKSQNEFSDKIRKKVVLNFVLISLPIQTYLAGLHKTFNVPVFHNFSNTLLKITNTAAGDVRLAKPALGLGYA